MSLVVGVVGTIRMTGLYVSPAPLVFGAAGLIAAALVTAVAIGIARRISRSGSQAVPSYEAEHLAVVVVPSLREVVPGYRVTSESVLGRAPGRPTNVLAEFDQTFHLLLARKDGAPPALPEWLQRACLDVKALLGTPICVSFTQAGIYVAVPTAGGLPPFESGGLTAPDARTLAADLSLAQRLPPAVETLIRALS